MEPSDLSQANFILNAIQVGGLIGFMTISLLAFLKGWIYSATIVDEFKKQIVELTAALKSANDGMERMAEAWEARNKIESDRARDDMLYERLRRDRGKEV